MGCAAASHGMAGMAGFEPTTAGVKVLCLTAWRHPIVKPPARERKSRSGRSGPLALRSLWGGRWDSNPRSSEPQSDALTNYATPTIFLVRQKGLEPPAYCLEGSCSIQLSYWRKWIGAGDGNRTRIPSLEGWCPGHCATPAFALRKNRQLCYNSISALICQHFF